ncbi:unnamed protein product, partial [Mesorhabditis belari]|uniref:Uncharacterized protein n=1 Tax=Mesorhabditis belari TaxID=2138241 RepID=A0AAF3F8H7_9BILA
MFPENFAFRRDLWADGSSFSSLFYRNVFTMGALLISLLLFVYTAFHFIIQYFVDLSQSLYAIYRIHSDFEPDSNHQPLFQLMLENMWKQKEYPIDIPSLFLFSAYMMYLFFR